METTLGEQEPIGFDGAVMESADQIVATVGGHVAGQTIKLLLHRR
jgi:hypothetical protein